MEPEVYDRMYECKDDYWWFVNRRLLIQKLTERFANLKVNGKILDAGCGPGVMLPWLREYGWTVGLDNSEIALGFCLKDNGKPLCCGSILQLPFKKNTFDLAIIGDVLYHNNVHDDMQAIGEIYASLKRGGIALFLEPAFEVLRRKHDLVEHSARRYSVFNFKRKVTAAGFRVADIFYANNFIFFPVLLVKMTERFIDLWRGSCSDLIALPAGLNRIFTFLAMLETRLSLRVKLPFGVTVVCVAVKD